MDCTERGPINLYWHTMPEESSVALANCLSQFDIDWLEPWRAEVAAAGADLAAGTDFTWRWPASTPMVVLLRAVARLATIVPEATSPLAAGLIDAVALQASADATASEEPVAKRTRAARSRRRDRPSAAQLLPGSPTPA